MQKINTISELRDEIRLLEGKQSIQVQAMKEQFINVRESLRPVNLLKTTFKEVVSSPDLASNILNAAVGLSAGIISKRMFVGSTHNPIKRLFGTLLEAGVATVITTKGDSIRNSISHLISTFTRKKEHQDEDQV